MANINKIALRIYVGAVGDSLLKQPVVSVSDVPQEFHPTAPTLVVEQQVWVITHAQDYTLYATSSKRCYTPDGRPGQILICLFLPPQKRLADGQSPLGVLGELMDIFVVHGLPGGKLPNTAVGSSPFNTLLGKYRLEDRPMLLPIMAGQAPAAFCVESKAQLDAMMRHSRYSILSSVGRLELGFNCKSTITLIKKGPPKRLEKPSLEHEKPEPANYKIPKQKVVSGGLPLDDAPVVVNNNTNWLKKLLKIVAISVGVVFGLFVLLGIIGILMEDDSQQVTDNDDVENVIAVNRVSDSEKEVDFVAEGKSVPHKVKDKGMDIPEQAMPESKGEAKTKAAMPVAGKNKMEEKARKEEEEKELEKKIAAEAEARTKGGLLLKRFRAKKAMEEKARKEAEEKELEKKKAAEDASWQANIRKYAQSCPIQLRLGVRITSITCNLNSMTFVVSYEELSKYDLGFDDKTALIKDRVAIFKKYCSDVPKGVGTTVIQKDKAGRTM